MEDNKKLIFGALAGFIAGGLLVAFTTPKTGKENQDYVLDKVDQMKSKILEFKTWLKDNIKNVTESESDQVKNLISDLESKIKELTKK